MENFQCPGSPTDNLVQEYNSFTAVRDMDSPEGIPSEPTGTFGNDVVVLFGADKCLATCAGIFKLI